MTTIPSLPTREHIPRLMAPPRRPGAPGAATGPGMTVRDLLRITRRRKWMILLTFVICLSAAGTGTFLWRTYAPFYTASALLEVSPPAGTVMESFNPMWTREVIDRYKRTEAALVKQPYVLQAVVEDPRVTSKTWFHKRKDTIFVDMEDKFDVSLMAETQLIKLSLSGTEKDELADIVNALADAFVRYSGESPRKEREDLIGRLANTRTELMGTVARLRGEMSLARGASPIAAMDARRSTLSITLQMLTEEVGKAQIEQTEAEAAMQEMQRLEASGDLSKGMQVQQQIEMDPTVRGLQVQLLEERTRLENLKTKFLPEHRQVKTAQVLVLSLDQQYKEKREEATKQALDGLRQMRQIQYAVATQRLAGLTERLSMAGEAGRDLEKSLERIDTANQDMTDILEQVRAIDRRLTDLRVQGRGTRDTQKESGVTVRHQATTPREISTPRWEIMLPLGALLGLVLGFGLAFLVEMADTSVKTPSDLARRVDLPLLGMVPHSDDMEEDIDDFRRVTLLAPHSPASEAFRQIRTNLLFSGPAQERRSLLVTSPAPEDGRTTVVLNLATAMAQAGRRVLVVDANFRQPAIAALFPEAAAAGLSSALVGQAAWREVVSPTGVPNLSVMTSGPLPPNPAELLGSEMMRQLIGEMTAEYDQVLFDGSPVMVVSDAAVLSTQVDGVILVVRAGNNSVGIVQRATEQLARVGARNLGVVLQAVRSTAGGYLRKNYETFYEYQQKPLPQSTKT